MGAKIEAPEQKRLPFLSRVNEKDSWTLYVL